MNDMMTFPETVEEFMYKYKITDTEQIYTNGAELVPIFRMKQWFDHKPEQKKGEWIECGEPNQHGEYELWYWNVQFVEQLLVMTNITSAPIAGRT